jgi:hypothetical protein
MKPRFAVLRRPGMGGYISFTRSTSASALMPFNRVWHSSEAHNLSHSGIPPGLKLDSAYTN